MFNNFIKVTLRTLYREKIYATLNIAGLSIAIGCCIILGLYIRSELTYDRHHHKHKQIYRIIKQNSYSGELMNFKGVSHQLGPLLKKDFPEIIDYVRFAPAREKHLFRHGDNAFYCEATYYADNSVFDVFTHKIIYGDPANALVDAKSIAVNDSFAKKYFGTENPVGKLISDDVATYKISLVFADLPENSSIKYDVLLSYKARTLNVRWAIETIYGGYDETFLLMPEDYDASEFDKISSSILKRYITNVSKNREFQNWKIWLQPITDIHLDKHLHGLGAEHYYLYGFFAVAVFILLVASINYINLSIARATKRAKEVEMRKILGSSKISLVIWFLGESIFFSLIAFLLGLALAEACLIFTNLNDLLGKSLSIDFFNEPGLLWWMFAISFSFGLITGIYPALYLSSMKPVSAMTAGYKAGKYSIRLREVLVLTQFIISVCIIACTLLMFLQTHYISNKPLGFKKENRLLITYQGADLIDKVPVLKNELLKNKDIYGVSFCHSIIGQSSGVTILGNKIRYNMMVIDKDFIAVMGMEIISGTDFIGDIPENYIVNETMAKKLGCDQIGQSYYPKTNPGRLIGIVKDFHFSSLYDEIDSFMFKPFRGTEEFLSNFSEGTMEEKRTRLTGYLVLNINSENTPQTINYIENKFKEFDPVHPFEFKFLDDVLNEMYISEQNLMKLIGIFSAICIFISCLGLFGLTAFSTEQRTKEIGIRKVLGATFWQIITLFSKRILLLVLGGSVFASLGAYYVMDEWLSRFAYRTDIELWVFFTSAAGVAILAFITIAAQVFRAAQADPVKALRYE